jgi:hypothetical protein
VGGGEAFDPPLVGLRYLANGRLPRAPPSCDPQVDESIEFDPPIDVLDDEEDETCYGFLPSEPMKGDPHFTTAAPVPVPAPAVPEAAPAQVTVQAPEVAAAPAQPPRYRIKKRRIEPEPATEPT